MSKNIVIIGGTKGIGEALCQLLAENHKVYCISRNAGANIPGVEYIYMDVNTEELDMDQLPETIDGLAYLPGTIRLRPFHSLKEDLFREDFEINVMGAVKVLKQCYRPLKKGNKPSVILFSTVAVQQGMPFHSSIAMAKGAIEGLVRSLAAEWAPSIRVNGIAPSITDTPLAAGILSNEDRKERSAQRHPLKKIGMAQDVAKAAAFLLGDDAGWISGQIMGVDGGLSSLRV